MSYYTKGAVARNARARSYEEGYNKQQFAARQIAKFMDELAKADIEAVHQQASPVVNWRL